MAGSAESRESRDWGEGAAYQGSASSDLEDDTVGGTPTRERGLYLARPELKKGFKQENVARGGIYAHPGPKPPQQHLKPKRKDNWAATAAAAFIGGRAPGARVCRSLVIPTP